MMPDLSSENRQLPLFSPSQNGIIKGKTLDGYPPAGLRQKPMFEGTDPLPIAQESADTFASDGPFEPEESRFYRRNSEGIQSPTLPIEAPDSLPKVDTQQKEDIREHYGSGRVGFDY